MITITRVDLNQILVYISVTLADSLSNCPVVQLPIVNVQNVGRSCEHKLAFVSLLNAKVVLLDCRHLVSPLPVQIPGYAAGTVSRRRLAVLHVFLRELLPLWTDFNLISALQSDMNYTVESECFETPN